MPAISKALTDQWADDPEGLEEELAGLDRAWVAMRDFNGVGWGPVDWIEGYIFRRDEPDELTRALMKVIIDAYHGDS